MSKETTSFALVVTSEGESISQQEFERRKKDPGYCVGCGAKIVPTPLKDRCAKCSASFARAYYEGEKYSGMSGLMGGE